ncbi:MAG: hypothetical protein JW720_13340 [Sedimentisphaerales bacterium]|nr:hypothetical protein [Sedimentisphaerales bacterium]
MLKAFEKKLRLVRLRCSINLLIRWAGRILTAAGAAGVLIALAEQLLAIEVIDSLGIQVFFGAAAFWILVLWAVNQPSRVQASLLLDERLRLRERFSTALALADSEDPFAKAACSEARRRAQNIEIPSHFPIRPERCWIYAAGAWGLAAAIVLFMPQKDLLGYLRKQDEERTTAKKLEEAKIDIKKVAEPVRLVVSRLGDPNLSEALGKLNALPKDATPQDVKRHAIRTLGDLSEQIKKMQNTAQLESLDLMQKMLKQLRGSTDMFSQKLLQSLAKGDFGDASKQLEQMRKQLEESGLSDEQRKELAKQLAEMGRKIRELAEKNSELEKELEKLGLDKKLAGMSEKQLRESLQKQGLNKEQIAELLQKASACRSACSRCSKLGQAMAAAAGGAGGSSADDLSSLMEQLDELQATKEQLAAMQASLAQISQCMGGLGEGMCDGLGCMGEFKEGYSDRYGKGTGGPGTGYGPRGIDESGQTSTKKTKVDGKGAEGPIVASWYFKGTQIKGESRREFSEVVQAGRDSAAEAINENEIPRKYEDAVKTYFGNLEKAGEE